METPISNEQLQHALLDFCNKKLKTSEIQFGVWKTKDVIGNLHIKSIKIKNEISNHQFAFVGRSNKILNEDEKRKLINQVKIQIKKMFADQNITGKMKIFKINDKDNTQAFFVMPFNVEKAYATINMKIQF